jgi:hypothetical protein
MKLTAAILAMCSLPAVAQAVDRIPQANLNIPVLVQVGPGRTAAGFFFDDSTNFAYFVTAKHVLYADGKLRAPEVDLFFSLSEGKALSERVHAKLHLSSLEADGLLRVHPTHDVALCRIGEIKDATNGQRNVIRPKRYYETSTQGNSSPVSITPNKTLRFAKVPVGNSIFVFGYPASIGLKQLPQIDYHKPLLRQGIVAGLNDSTSTIVIDGASYFGNSGGPVMLEAVEGFGADFLLIGLVSQYVPFAEEWQNVKQGYSHFTLSNSGYTVVTPVDAIFEILW